jgi:predicted XRE-type DNA-binding protein
LFQLSCINTREISDEAKVAAIQALPKPTAADQVRSVMGMIGFYRGYVPSFSKIAKQLNSLLKKGSVFEWGEEHAEAYQQIKTALTTPGLVLRHLVPDMPFHLYTDWSTHGIAAVLNQRDDEGNEYMVACISRSLNEHERRYEAWKGEALAAVWGVKTFRPYLHGVHFHLHTDHRPLLWLLTAKEPTGQQARWILSLQDYQFSIVHRPGASNIADMPSRCPQATTVDVTGARMHSSSDPLLHPLPLVLHADGTTDTTHYTRDLLNRDRTASLGAEHHPATAALLMAAASVQCSAVQLKYQALEFATASHSDGFMDDFAPLPAALLAGHNGSFADTAEAVPDADQAAATEQRKRLAAAADIWVRQAQLPQAQVLSLAGLYTGEPDRCAVRHTEQLSTAVVGNFFSQQGVGGSAGAVWGVVCRPRDGPALWNRHPPVPLPGYRPSSTLHCCSQD